MSINVKTIRIAVRSKQDAMNVCMEYGLSYGRIYYSNITAKKPNRRIILEATYIKSKKSLKGLSEVKVFDYIAYIPFGFGYVYYRGNGKNSMYIEDSKLYRNLDEVMVKIEMLNRVSNAKWQCLEVPVRE